MKTSRTAARKKSTSIPPAIDSKGLELSLEDRKADRVPTGIAYLDDSLSGGFPAGSAILLGGNPGAGKTVFGMTFLSNGAELYDEKGAYISFSEDRLQMYTNMKRLGMDLQKLEDAKKIWFMEMYAAQGAEMGDLMAQMINKITSNGIKRVVIDSISAIAQSFEHEYEARQVFHTVISKLIRSIGCTTLVISERLSGSSEGLPFEEFVADGILAMKAGPPRELEVRKMRGTRLLNRRFLCTIDEGFKVLRTEMVAPAHAKRWQPIPFGSNVISSGSEDLDRAIGGGFPCGTYAILEADTHVSLNEISLVTHGVIMNFLTQGHGVLILPVGGADTREVVGQIRPYLNDVDLRFLRVADELRAEEKRTKAVSIPAYVTFLKGGKSNIDVDNFMLFDVLSDLRELTENKPALRIIGYDTMQTTYSELPDRFYSEIGSAIMRTKAAGDLTIGIARPTLSVLPRILDMVDWHFQLSKTYGALILEGIKPQTPLYAVLCDVSKGHPRVNLRVIS